MKCPKCGSEQMQFVTKASGGGFSFLDACCWSSLLGPLGMLCGIQGVSSEDYWVCQNCGNQFEASTLQHIEKEQQKKLEEAERAERNYLQALYELDALHITPDQYQDFLKKEDVTTQKAETLKKACSEIVAVSRNSTQPEIRSIARRMDLKALYYVAIAFIIIGFILLLFIEGTFLFGLILVIMGCVSALLHGHFENKYRPQLIELVPEYGDKWNKYERTKDELLQINRITRPIHTVVSYEKEHEV